MITIIQDGDLNKLRQIRRFTCEYCGCIFEGDREDYEIDSQYNQEYIKIRCPYCNNMVYYSIY